MATEKSCPSSPSLPSCSSSIDTLSSITNKQLSITDNFISKTLVKSLLQDASELYKHGAYITGKIGGRTVKNERANNTKRRCDICGLFDDALKAPSGVGNVEARETLFDIMGDIREALQDELQIELSESMELQYLHYPGDDTSDDTSASGGGGFYKRHLDHTADDNGKELIRRISLLLYLNTDEWNEKDGGILRAYVKQSAKGDKGVPIHQQDVIPDGGRLVLFDSATVEHEVLPTNKERWAIVGWFMSDNKKGSDTKKRSLHSPKSGNSKKKKKRKKR